MAETNCRSLLILVRRLGGRKLSDMTVHPKNITGGGRDSSVGGDFDVAHGIAFDADVALVAY